MTSASFCRVGALEIECFLDYNTHILAVLMLTRTIISPAMFLMDCYNRIIKLTAYLIYLPMHSSVGLSCVAND
jgi:hypothetical protein